MGYTPIFNALDKKPISQYFRNGELGSLHIAFRDQLSIPTWLMLGALIQGVLCFLPYRNLLLVGPAAAIILYKIVVVVLQTIGVLRNPLMDGAIPNRTAILYADEHGKYETPAGTEVCTIQLAAVCNHPLGMFAPGFKEVGDRFTAMTKELEADATKYGYLGSTTWINQSDRVTGNEQMIIVYFKSLHHLHEYAHGERHTDTMLWWSRNADKMKHIGIMHEVSAAPKNGWEGIYINYHPTGLGATFTEANVNGEKKWMSPLVAGKGKLAWSKGRMGREFSDKEWVAFDEMLVEDGGRYGS